MEEQKIRGNNHPGLFIQDSEDLSGAGSRELIFAKYLHCIHILYMKALNPYNTL